MTAEDLGKALRPKERQFVHEYLVDWNGTQAALRCGYKASKSNNTAATMASRLLRDERVKAYLDALIREGAEDQSVTRESLILKLMEIYRRCMSAEPVMEWDSDAKEWKESGVWRFDAKGATKALELLSRITGNDAPVKLENGEGELIIQLRKAAENGG